MIYTRKDNGTIRIKADGIDLTISSDKVDMEIDGYVVEPTKVDVKPLLPYQWQQTAPFNSQLPVFENFDSVQAPTGCTQIALAMVAAYYGNIGVGGKKYPKGCDKTAEYVSKKGTAYEKTIPALPATTFDYAAFNLAKPEDFKTDKAKEAVGKFLKYICYSDHTSFGVSASSCSLSRALSETINKRMHLANKAVLIEAKDDMETFKERVYEELRQGNPVLMGTSGTKTASDGTKSVMGHTFVCDGYRASDDTYHFYIGFPSSAFNRWYKMENAVLSWQGTTWDWTHNTGGEVAMQAIVNLHPYEV